MYKLCGEIHGDLFIDNFTIYEFNLSKKKNPCYNKYAFIKMLNYNEDELNQKCICDEDMEKYNKEIKRVNSDLDFIEFLTPEEDAEKYFNTEKALEYEKGIEQKKDTAKKMKEKNIDMETISSITGLSISE